MKVKFKRVRPGSMLPQRGSEMAAGLDLYACIKNDVKIYPEEKYSFPTGLSAEIPEGYFGGIYARSGMATKRGLRPSNCVGVIDADYRGEIIVSIYNDSGAPQTISNGDRIAQLIVQPYLNFDVEEVEELSDTERGAGGFGSTGTGAMNG